LRARRQVRDSGDVSQSDQPSERPSPEVVIEEGDGDSLDDPELGLLIGVGREVLGTHQGQKELRARRDVVEGVCERRRVDRVGGALRGKKRWASAREGESAEPWDLRSGE